MAWAWQAASGTGTVDSWTVTHHGFGPGVETPFVVALVRLDDQEDIRIPGYIDGPADGSGLEIGMPVRVGFVDAETSSGAPIVLIQWMRERWCYDYYRQRKPMLRWLIWSRTGNSCWFLSLATP